MLKALELKVGQSEPIGEQDRARLKLDDSATRLEFRGADGKPLARLTIGAKFFSRETGEPGARHGDGRYVMLPDEPKVVYIVADPLALASVKSADWIHRGGFAAEKVKSMQVTLAGGERWKIERPGDNADWKLAPMNAGREAGRDPRQCRLLFAQQRGPGRRRRAGRQGRRHRPGQAGRDHRRDDLRRPHLHGEARQARRATTPMSRSPSRARAAQPAPTPRSAARNSSSGCRASSALAAHTLLVAKSKFEDMLKKRAELLEKKDAGRKK